LSVWISRAAWTQQRDVVDVMIEYPTDFAAQMMDYATRYRSLPSQH